MAIRLTGLASGLDTDSMVQELVSAYSTKLESYKKDKTRIEWTQEKWSDLNTKIYGFYTGSLSNLRMMSSFANKKNVTVSDTTKATVTANNQVANGTQTLEVKQLAKAGYLTGTKITTAGGETISSGTKLTDIGVSAGTMSLTVGGEEKSIDITSDMTVSGFVSALKEQGLNANFDTTQQRFFISSANSGAEEDFSFAASSSVGLNNLKALGLATSEDIISLEAVQSLDQTTLQRRYDERYNNELSNLASAAISSGNISDELAQKAYENYVAGLAEDETDAYGDVDSFKAALLDGTADSSYLEQAYGDLFGDAIRSTIEKEEYQKAYREAYEAKKTELKDSLDGYAVKQEGQNAIIELNGATFEGNSNQFTINGLSITATGVTDGVISISTATDVDGIYDMIKGFFTDYNNIINELTENYNAESAKGYDPLSDEEKDSMSDTEIENWEKKIKTALLRRDDTVSSIISAMNSAMQQGITINGKTYNLSTFGIQTQSIISAKSNTQNAFHIDGNSDDSVSADNTDKLKSMIASDPDTVAEFFTQLAKNLYSSLTTKMQSTTLSSAYTIYNDKSLKEDLSDIEDTIEKWEDKVADYEETWYKKFSDMETALSKLQSSTSSLTSLLGS